MRTKDYNLARAILICLERSEKKSGKEYSTTTPRLQKVNLIKLVTCLGYSKLNNCAEKCKIANRDDCIGNDATAVSIRGAISKKIAESEVKGKAISPQSWDLMPGAPGTDHKCNKNGKHRNGKRRRKTKTERKRSHANRTRLFLLVQDQKEETKEEVSGSNLTTQRT